MKDIILASASPRRTQLLNAIGLDHTVQVSNVDEEEVIGLPPRELAETLAQKKAGAVAARVKNGIIIGADTIVVLDNKILGKPSSKKEAVRMLAALQGRAHQVITGLAVVEASNGFSICTHQITSVTFRKLEEREILAYVETGEPMDKAGAYGIQELGSLLVEEIRGCYFNVVGLPLPLLGQVLKHFGVNLLYKSKVKYVLNSNY